MWGQALGRVCSFSSVCELSSTFVIMYLQLLEKDDEGWDVRTRGNPPLSTLLQ